MKDKDAEVMISLFFIALGIIIGLIVGKFIQ